VRRQITRIEVVRIRPRIMPRERLGKLIDDPWKVHFCERNRAGCTLRFSDPDFEAASRETLYYVRAIESPSPAVNAGNLRCESYGGACDKLDPCVGVPAEDDCLALNDERAWSSPIWVGFED
jgi:hypothetical protein